MVLSSLHVGMAVVLAVLALATHGVWCRSGRAYTVLVLVVIGGLAYDNAVLGAGRWLEPGLGLRALSLPRYWLHAFTTPLLVIAAVGAARAAGLPWARSRAAHGAFCVLASALVAWGVVADIAHLDLQPQVADGVVGYRNALASAPVPAIATIGVLVGVGALLWWGAGWPWVAAGAAVMAVASGLGGVSPVVTNVGELALAGSLYATERHLAGGERRSRAVPVPVAHGG